MIALLIFSCSTATPPTAVESSREPFDETLTVQIPSGCEHLIVDVLPKDSTGVVVACFDRFSRETFSRRYDDAPRRLVIELNSRHALVTADASGP